VDSNQCWLCTGTKMISQVLTRMQKAEDYVR
jgi:hypothetical protein